MAGKNFHASTDRVGDLSTTFSIYTDAQCKNLEASVRIKVDKEDANNDYVSAYASVTLDPGRYWIKETYRIIGTMENTDIYPIRITENTKSPAKLKDVLVGDPKDFPSLTKMSPTVMYTTSRGVITVSCSVNCAEQTRITQPR